MEQIVNTIEQTAISPAFFLGVGLGFILGGAVGFIVALRSKKPESNVTAIQIMAIVTFFGYMIVSFAFGREVSWIIAIAILATGYGAKGGQIIEKILERNTK